MSDMSRIAALLGDPARANILTALMDGRALTAKELAYAAHVSPQTTSGHLAKLTDAQLLTVARQGRHRYFRLSPVDRPYAGKRPGCSWVSCTDTSAWRGGEALRTARTCYDHLAGRLGVALADCAEQRRASGAIRRRRRSDTGRCLPCKVWRRPGRGQACLLPSLP